MAKDKITEYDATANNNTVCGDVNIAENSALPSDMNNFAREIMSHLKEGLGSGTPLYVDQTNNRVGINKTPTVALDVSGSLSVDGGTIKLNGDYPVGTGNVALGNAALDDGSLSGAYNVAIGLNSLTVNTTGSNNVGVGVGSLYSNTSGSFNIAIGVSALQNSVTASDNTAVGYHAAIANTTGAYNTAIGRSALRSNTTANYNNAFGFEALYSNTTTQHNNAFGWQSLKANNGGISNSGFGDRTLTANTTGDNNTAVGYMALSANTTASNNTAVGYHALFDKTTGGDNTAVGSYSATNTTTGIRNTAIGYEALQGNTTGSNNVAVGWQAMYTDSTANNSVAVGWQAMLNATGDNQVAIGREALESSTGANNTAVGTTAGANLTTGLSNILIGYECGSVGVSLTTGSNNIYIGGGISSGIGNAQSRIAIGNSVAPVGDNYFVFGKGTGNDRVYNQFTANASWTRVSDERYKKEITDNTDCGLAFINDLRPVTFKWKAKSEIDSSLPDYDASKTTAEHTEKMYGLIAQEVKQALDNHNITDFAGHDVLEDSGIQAISQEMFIHPLIKAVQELSAKNDALEARLSALENG